MAKFIQNISDAKKYNEELCKAHEITAELYHKTMDKAMEIYNTVGMNSPEYDEHKKNEKVIINRLAELEDLHREVCWEWDLELLF